MNENNIPVEIKRTEEGYIAKVGKIQTGPLPTLEEARREGKELHRLEATKTRFNPMGFFIVASLVIGSIVGVGFNDWGIGVLSSIAAFFGMVVSELWITRK